MCLNSRQGKKGLEKGTSFRGSLIGVTLSLHWCELCHGEVSENETFVTLLFKLGIMQYQSPSLTCCLFPIALHYSSTEIDARGQVTTLAIDDEN